MKNGLILLVMWLGMVAGEGQTAEDWQEKVKKEYPEIGVKGSAMNEKFVARYKQLKAADPDYFRNPEWPLNIAKEIYGTAVKRPELKKPEEVKVPVVDEKPAGRRPAWVVKSSVFAGGSDTVADLKKLLSGFGEPKKVPSEGADEMIYGGVTFLMPLKEAKGKLEVTREVGLKTKVACAGFPEGLYYNVFDGKFEGHYNRIYLVTDSKDQVVSIQLVDEKPDRSYTNEGATDQDWRTYNFVNARVKSKRSLGIRHEVTKEKGCIVVNSELYDPGKSGEQFQVGGFSVRVSSSNAGGSGRNAYMETCRWYAPQALVDAILGCIGK